MLLGQFEYKVDEKGRVPLPPKFRQELKGGLVLTAGPDRCIFGYSVTEWGRLASDLKVGLVAPSKLRRLRRALFASAFNLELDGQGRVALPQVLREHAGIDTEAVVIGADTYFEVWSKTGWQAENAASREQAWQIWESFEQR